MATLVLLVTVSSCAPDESVTEPGTVGPLPTPTLEDTLAPIDSRPVVVDDTGTVPDGVMFAGEVCRALTADDLRAAAASVPTDRTDPEEADPEDPPPDESAPPGEVLGPVTSLLVSVDACRYVVREPLRFSVLVQVRSQAQFDDPAPVAADGTPLAVVALSGVGLAAKGIDRGVSYEVLVAVEGGWFAVVAPDRDTAVQLARAVVVATV